MKRSFLFLILFFLVIPCSIFGNESCTSEEIVEDDVIDEFDALFDEAEDDIVVEESEVPTIESSIVESQTEAATVIIRESTGPIQFSGSFESNIGAAATYQDNALGISGALTMANTLYMTIRPASDFTLHGSLYISDSTLASYSPLTLSSFYFDYLWRNCFISAGKKGLSWGNIRLFNTGYYGPIYTNVLSSFGPLIAQVQVPFHGNWTFVGAGSASLNWKQIKYAASYNNVVGHTNIDIYGTVTSGSKSFGLELKRTIAGFDIYGQAIGWLEGGYKKASGTAGIYRLWETDGPDYGFNIEYQFVHDRDGTVLPEYHKLALEAGIKKLGKSQNFKIGTQWGHNITDGSGHLNLAFLFNGIFQHANWTNAISVTYGSGFSNPNITLGSTISLSIDY